MTDEEKKREQEGRQQLAASYRTMMSLSAWKDLEERFAAIEKIAIANEDEIPVLELGNAVGMIGECRGRRTAIKQIRGHLDYRLNGLT